MLPVSMTMPATVPQRSEIPEGLTNYPVFISAGKSVFGKKQGRKEKHV
jgi:hypothetical protein